MSASSPCAPMSGYGASRADLRPALLARSLPKSDRHDQIEGVELRERSLFGDPQECYERDIGQNAD